jgi:hypothetical protein
MKLEKPNTSSPTKFSGESESVFRMKNIHYVWSYKLFKMNAKIGKFASYKPIFLPGDNQKKFSKISG